ncbi:hypothetical protein ACHWQZ_G015570 [Mnemiopsis leidyi]
MEAPQSSDLDKTPISDKQRFRKDAKLWKDEVDNLLPEDTCNSYTPWDEIKNESIDFVLVYATGDKMTENRHVVPDPRRIDREDVKKAEDGDEAAKMRIDYIKLLIENGLEIEIENFSSNFKEYRAIKIRGSDSVLDTWAQKFLLMKPVKPPLDCIKQANLGKEKSVAGLISMYNEHLYDFVDMNKKEKSGPDIQVKDEKIGTKNGKSDSQAFQQLIHQNKRHNSLWATRISNWLFKLRHKKDEQLLLAFLEENLSSRAIRAPFNLSKKNKFLRHSEPEFYNRSERSLMVFRILENPEKKSKLQSKNENVLNLKNMIDEGYLEAAYPIHAGDYRLNNQILAGDKKLKNPIPPEHYVLLNISGETESNINPRQILRYFWSASNMKWKSQPFNIIRNYFGSVTAMYFAFLGFYTMSLITPALVGLAFFIYGLYHMSMTDTSRHICESGEKYLMCADCYIDGTCNATYLSDYCFTTTLTSIANNDAAIVFSIFMMVWLAVFVTTWKRKEKTKAHLWGTTNSHIASAEVRVNFKQPKNKQYIFNTITGQREIRVPFIGRLPNYILSYTVVVLFLAAAVLVTMTITIYNYTLSISIQKAKDFNPFTRKYATEIASLVTGCVSAVFIIGLSFLYKWIANLLTNMENHKTQRDHTNHLIFKIYVFDFINYYSTLFYIAFFKGKISSPANPRYLYGTSLKIESCAPGGCMSEVSIQMIIIMLFKQLIPAGEKIFKTLNLKKIKTIKEMLIKLLLTPFAICCGCAKKRRNKAKDILKKAIDERPQFAKDFELREPAEMYEEYVNNIIQLGFLTMFVTAFPIAPIICYVFNIWEIRKDATRYVKRVRRPIGFRCEGIGTWMNILEVLSRIAVLVNATLIAFTFDFIPHMIYRRYLKSGETTQSYVDFMLASYTFEHQNPDGSTVNQTCRYWSYTKPTTAAESSFWLDLMLHRVLFIFLFQNIIWAVVNVIELKWARTPQHVKERMVLEEKIAEEWLSDDDDDEDGEGVDKKNLTPNKG